MTIRKGISKIQYLISSLYNKYFHMVPKVLSNEQTIEMIVNNKYSISRFGDGEFNMLLDSYSDIGFQKGNEELGIRLKEILKSNENNLLIAIPKIFEDKDLEFREEASKRYWNKYLRLYRSRWYAYLNFNQVYGASTFTRNYIACKDKKHSSKYFEKLKSIWNGRDLLIVEGKYTRLGIGNDLFGKANSIKRILAPNEDAFSCYYEIFNAVKLQDKNRLVLISLGPTATVLAYDLCKEGFQALDIGHIDIEYEWLLRGATSKISIPYKYTNESNCGRIKKDDFRSDEYDAQIICKIGID